MDAPRDTQPGVQGGRRHLRSSTTSALVGFELWQVKAGTIFDNIIVTDDIKEAEAFLAATYTASKAAEKEALDAQEKEKNAAAEAERNEAAEAAKKAAEAAEADEDDEDDHDEL